jgi:hypothetical protein
MENAARDQVGKGPLALYPIELHQDLDPGDGTRTHNLSFHLKPCHTGPRLFSFERLPLPSLALLA